MKSVTENLIEYRVHAEGLTRERGMRDELVEGTRGRIY